MSKKLTTEEFITKSKSFHGDKYSYEKTIYSGNKTKVTITCPIHGDFEQLPGNHYRYSCIKCAGCDTKTTQEFIKEAMFLHSNKYDYSKTVYLSGRKNINIICPKHGVFTQRASVHLEGRGCSKCGIEKVQEINLDTLQDYLAKAISVHGTRYCYNSVVYTNSNTKVIITCPTHGDFEQTPSAHLQGQGCPQCGIDIAHEQAKLTLDDFVSRSKIIHKGKYEYSNVCYVNNATKVTITCPVHGDFKQIPGSHLRGCGCPGCGKYGFQPDKKAILYYLKITLVSGTILYKIGITNKTVSDRFALKDLQKIEVLKQKDYLIGLDAYNQEQEILKEFQAFRYTGPKVLISNGDTELFNKDISIIDDRLNNIFL